MKLWLLYRRIQAYKDRALCKRPIHTLKKHSHDGAALAIRRWPVLEILLLLEEGQYKGKGRNMQVGGCVRDMVFVSSVISGVVGDYHARSTPCPSRSLRRTPSCTWYWVNVTIGQLRHLLQGMTAVGFILFSLSIHHNNPGTFFAAMVHAACKAVSTTYHILIYSQDRVFASSNPDWYTTAPGSDERTRAADFTSLAILSQGSLRPS